MSDILTAVYDVHGAAPFWALAAMLICGVWMPQNHQPVVTVRQYGPRDPRTISGVWLADSVKVRPGGDVEFVFDNKAGSSASSKFDDIRHHRYGNVSREPGLILVWPAGELTRIQWRTIPTVALVRLAEVRMIHPALFDDVRQWCARLEARLRPKTCSPWFSSAAD